ncbi:rhamnogalacturonan lyase [Nocardiopsis sediminis]|uniref:Rhamnogalacturonan lyase n=1 Tax=Nocardiopsis sediminis TaxID=1778267 RepID=A0ABV8FQR1_9ACTN
MSRSDTSPTARRIRRHRALLAAGATFAALVTAAYGLHASSSAADSTDAPPAPAGVPAETANLGRGAVSVGTGDGNLVSWRLLAGDPADTGFNLYRGDTRVNDEPITGTTSYLDEGAPADAEYTVAPVVGSEEVRSPASDPALRLENGSTDIPVSPPPAGGDYTYEANDGSVGDLDGDGEYEIVLKWQPTNAKDNSQSGATGNTFIDAYELDGTQLWRIDMGRNIRSGAHYTQFIVYDLDNDGSAEVAAKTADGTVDGGGTVIGDGGADHRNSGGYVLSGPEFLTVFNGGDGTARTTVDYVPPRGNVADWGDDYGNRVDRFLAGVAYLDGENPSLIMARGYYTRTVVSAYRLSGSTLSRQWTFDSRSSTNGPEWEGQGFHSLSVADLDGDGRDEIAYGAMAIDDNGHGLWNTGYGHGDALHVGAFVPGRDGVQVYGVAENGGSPSSWLVDGATGETIFTTPSNGGDNGRGVAADIYPDNPGAEFWSSNGSGNLLNAEGESVGRKPGSINFLVWWDGDLSRELLDRTQIDKYGPDGDTRLLTGSGVAANNGTKATPVFSGDILGDWREEVIWRTSDNTALRIYSTDIPTDHSRPSLTQDRQYRLALAWQQTAYNQPPHPSFAMEE